MGSALDQPGPTTTSGYHQVMRRSGAVSSESAKTGGAESGSSSTAGGMLLPPPDARRSRAAAAGAAGIDGSRSAAARRDRAGALTGRPGRVRRRRSGSRHRGASPELLVLDLGQAGEPDGDGPGDLGGELRREAGHLLPGCGGHGVWGPGRAASAVLAVGVPTGSGSAPAAVTAAAGEAGVVRAGGSAGHQRQAQPGRRSRCLWPPACSARRAACRSRSPAASVRSEYWVRSECWAGPDRVGSGAVGSVRGTGCAWARAGRVPGRRWAGVPDRGLGLDRGRWCSACGGLGLDRCRVGAAGVGWAVGDRWGGVGCGGLGLDRAGWARVGGPGLGFGAWLPGCRWARAGPGRWSGCPGAGGVSSGAGTGASWARVRGPGCGCGRRGRWAAGAVGGRGVGLRGGGARTGSRHGVGDRRGGCGGCGLVGCGDVSGSVPVPPVGLSVFPVAVSSGAGPGRCGSVGCRVRAWSRCRRACRCRHRSGGLGGAWGGGLADRDRGLGVGSIGAGGFGCRVGSVAGWTGGGARARAADRVGLDRWGRAGRVRGSGSDAVRGLAGSTGAGSGSRVRARRQACPDQSMFRARPVAGVDRSGRCRAGSTGCGSSLDGRWVRRRADGGVGRRRPASSAGVAGSLFSTAGGVRSGSSDVGIGRRAPRRWARRQQDRRRRWCRCLQVRRRSRVTGSDGCSSAAELFSSSERRSSSPDRSDDGRLGRARRPGLVALRLAVVRIAVVGCRTAGGRPTARSRTRHPRPGFGVRPSRTRSASDGARSRSRGCPTVRVVAPASEPLSDALTDAGSAADARVGAAMTTTTSTSPHRAATRTAIRSSVGEQPGTQRGLDARHLPTRVQQAGTSIPNCLAVSTTRGIEMIPILPAAGRVPGSRRRDHHR